MSANAPSLENVCNGHTILTRNIVRDTGGDTSDGATAFRVAKAATYVAI